MLLRPLRPAPHPLATPASLRDPPLPKKDRRSVVFEETGGDVFRNGPSANEVQQGTLGDCGVIAALSSLARTHPETLQSAIRQVGTTKNERGEPVKLYEVRLYAKHAATVGRFPALGPKTRDGYTPIAITIDGEVPVFKKPFEKNGKLTDAYGSTRAGADDEKWVALFEKAYAELVGGYDNLTLGVQTGNVISTLTGKAADEVELQNADPDAAYAAISEGLKQKKLVLAETYFNNNERAPAAEKIGHALKRMYGDKIPGGKGPYNGFAPLDHGKPRYDPATFKYEDAGKKKNGLVSEHVYSVVGVNKDADGTRWVELRNPWGNVEPARWNPTGRDDGRFRVPLVDFMTLFASVSVG